jgi:hypothetical protein
MFTFRRRMGDVYYKKLTSFINWGDVVEDAWFEKKEM